ncbi:MAG: 30S ribosomal protein S13 [Thermoplasmatota archaeon]
MAAKSATKGKKDSSAEKADDFKFIVRMLSTDIDGERKIIDGITSIRGINYRMATIVANQMNIDVTRQMGTLSDEEVVRLTELVEDIPDSMPDWMLNRRKDMETGEDLHLIGSDLELTQKEDINELRKIRSYRGIRHENGHKVRGQRTASNGRTGATVGVSRKKGK